VAEDEEWAAHLADLQARMRVAGLGALLLGSETAGAFAAGHSRIGVHTPGWPFPVTIVPADGDPHVITADGDGALHLPADHVHGLIWAPGSLAESLGAWLGARAGRPVGVDALSPAGRAAIHAALPGSELVDATGLVAEAMLAKSPAEIERLAEVCRFAHRAAEAGLAGGRSGLQRALAGSFLVSTPSVSDRAVAVAVRRDGLLGEARVGPGSAALGRAAVGAMRAGEVIDDVAARLPAGVEVVGIGRGYEAPLMRAGMASPAGLQLREGAVLGVRWDRCAVTIVVTDQRHRYLSPPPEEVAR
jgi:hypothetical protein